MPIQLSLLCWYHAYTSIIPLQTSHLCRYHSYASITHMQPSRPPELCNTLYSFYL